MEAANSPVHRPGLAQRPFLHRRVAKGSRRFDHRSPSGGRPHNRARVDDQRLEIVVASLPAHCRGAKMTPWLVPHFSCLP